MSTCRECQQALSDEAPKCPHCGAPWPTSSSVRHANRRRLFVVFVVTSFAILAVVLFLAYQGYRDGTDGACEALQSFERSQGQPARDC